jgi:glyoxylase-like metal-dependent hydrolase (beta-lactamase superfamily II)
MIERVDGGYAATYLIQGKNGWVVVDPGTRLAAELTATRIGKAPVGLICATHFHVDHIGGIERLLAYYPNAAVMFSAGALPFAGGLEPLPVPVFRRWILGLIPVAVRLGHPLRNLYQAAISARAGILLPFFGKASKVNFPFRCRLQEGRDIRGLEGWRIIETPGHTPDSLCLFHSNSRSLISGDTIVNMSGCGELNRFCCSWTDIRKSFRKLSALPVENLYPGHGAPLCGIQDVLARVQIRP